MVSGVVTSFIGTFDSLRSQKDTVNAPHDFGSIATFPSEASLNQVMSIRGSPILYVTSEKGLLRTSLVKKQGSMIVSMNGADIANGIVG